MLSYGRIFITGEATALAMRTNIRGWMTLKSNIMTLKDYINEQDQPKKEKPRNHKRKIR